MQNKNKNPQQNQKTKNKLHQAEFKFLQSIEISKHYGSPNTSIKEKSPTRMKEKDN